MNTHSLITLLENLRKDFLELAYTKSPNNYHPVYFDHLSRKTLNGWCVLCSYTIFHILRKRGLNPTFCRSYNHAFIILNNWYIDITLEQFNRGDKQFPDIYLKQCAGDSEFHSIIQSTDQASKIWKVCQGWNQQVGIRNPSIIKMIKSY
jgi:hypothetical protein